LAIQGANPNSANNINALNNSGIGGDLQAGLAAAKPGMGRMGSFLAGFTGSMARSEARDAAAATAAQEATKNNVANLKTMFDAASKMVDEQQTQDNQRAIRAREENQDAETKRWHDIQHQDTQAKINKNGSETTDWSTPENMLNASRLEQAKLNELGLDHVSMRAINKSLTDLTVPDDQKAQIRSAIDQAHQQFEAWRAQQPWANGGKKKPAAQADQPAAAPAPATPPPATPIAGGMVPSNPPSPGFKQRSWRAATAPDGSRWLIDQNTGEKQPIVQAGKSAPPMANNMTKTMQTAPPPAAAPAQDDEEGES
jgi:hypothetical protein